MTPTPEHIEGWELAMEYMTLACAGNHDLASDCIERAFGNIDTAISYAVAVSNFAMALVHATGKSFDKTPSEVWEGCAARLQATRPPEWER